MKCPYFLWIEDSNKLQKLIDVSEIIYSVYVNCVTIILIQKISVVEQWPGSLTDD